MKNSSSSITTGVKMYCKASDAMGVLMEVAEYKRSAKIFQGSANLLKFGSKCLSSNRANLTDKLIYNSTSKKIKLEIPIKALLSVMEICDLLFKFSWPLRMFCVALKVTLLLISILQIFITPDRLKNGIASPNGRINFLLSCVLPLFADITPYCCDILSNKTASQIMGISISILTTLFLGNHLRKKGFGDVLSAAELTHQIASEEINLNPFKNIGSQDAQDLWNEPQNICSFYDSVTTLYSFLKWQLFYLCGRLEENNGRIAVRHG
jgi:hypothetical protein